MDPKDPRQASLSMGFPRQEHWNRLPFPSLAIFPTQELNPSLSILKLTEGSLAPVSCTAQGAAACSRTTCCQTLPMWEKLEKMIDEFFEGITLADLLKEGQKGL